METEETKESPLFVEKIKDLTAAGVYKFLLSNTPASELAAGFTLEQRFLHQVLGIPSVPIIGKYNKAEYRMCEVRGIIECRMQLDEKSQNYMVKGGSGTILFPPEVATAIYKFPLPVPVNSKKPEDTKKYKIKTDVYKITNNLRFLWVFHMNTPEMSANNVYNLVNQAHLFPDIAKRLTSNYPCGFFVQEKLRPLCGINEFTENDKSVLINSMRVEYSSLHAKGGGLAFSPNNLRFWMQTKQMLCAFWEVLLDVDAQENVVVLHWVINNTHDLFEKLLQETMTIKELVNELNSVIGKSDKNCYEILQEVRGVFCLE